MSRRIVACVAASVLAATGLVAVPGAADAKPRPKTASFQFQHLYPEIGSPHTSKPKLGPSKRGPVRLVSPSTVGEPARTKIPTYAAAKTTTSPTIAAAASVPVGIGPVRNGTFLSFNLADYLQLKVNVGSGNAMVRSTDMSLPGIGGNVTVGAVYNSLLHAADVPTGVISPGWRTRLGEDVRLYKNSDNSVTYAGPDGVSGVFTPSGSGYSTPKEFKGDLTSQSGGGWKYLDHGSGQQSYFNSSGLPSKVVDRNGNTTDFTYTGSHVSAITYKPKGETTGRQIKIGMYDGDQITRYTEDDGNGGQRIVVYSYDPSSHRLSQIQQAAGEVTTFGYDGAGNLSSVTNGKGKTTSLDYDANHRVLAVTQGGDSTAQITRLAYPSSTQSQVADPNTDQGKAVADVPHTTYTINTNDRVTKTVDPAGNTRSKTYTPFSDIASYTNANGGLTSNTFGANNGESLTRSVSPTGASASLTYGNSPTSQNPTAAYQPSAGSDTQGNSSTYTYDGAGNQTSTKNAQAAEAKVSYNDDGTVKDSTDPKNGSNSSTYSYDGNHQLASVTPPSGNTLKKKTFTYDGYGRVAIVTDGNGKKTSYTYDDDDRVLTIGYSDGTPTVTYTYDKAGNVFTRADAAGTTTFGYTARNLVAARQSTSGGGEIDWQYDAAGNLVNQMDGRGTDHYVHSVRNLLASMTDATGKQWIFKYDDDGNRTDTYFNYTTGPAAWSMHTVTSYDKSDRVTRVKTTGNSISNPMVSDLSYCYAKHVDGQGCSTDTGDDTGLRQWSTDNAANKTSVYTYDKGNRLTKATGVNGHDYGYGYDSDGNRTSQSVDGTTTQTLTFNSANQITSSGYGYDAAGNQTSSPTVTQMTYNAAQQLTRTKVGNTTTAYTYAGPDQTELVKTGTTSIVYGTATTPIAYTNGAATTYIERDDSGAPLAANVNGTDTAYATDGLGSVVATVNLAGTKATGYAYTPYGEQTGKNTGDTNLVGYTGALSDPATSNLYLSHRYYAPGQGGFTQQDTITKLADPQNGNLYAYASDNPTNYIDPTGQWSWSSFWGSLASGWLTGSECWAVGAILAPETAGVGAVVGGIACGAITGAVASGIMS
ncbi:RHS repeat domain-containing protein [Actinomadura opuntiae]|uniref:RHS repeat domain-containing protein n=1 Tax=Actinomadura sp. OS1-43 TaxID=604315 RepID=UPI00255ADE7C|nr:RHS repeat-associated core domain-containing protein [Actinomadura sp. OS1-43]MDL4812803.1 RHS repeat-associated core domain-containing protein [Actinomadura sp. OS1-43]